MDGGILITAGGTAEHIDTVRSITNHSTGRLGALTAEEFSRNGYRVTFLHGEMTAPLPSVHETVRIRTVAELERAFEALLLSNSYECVIHSMAVSDFTPHLTVDAEELAEVITKNIYGKLGSGLTGEEMTERVLNAILFGAENSKEREKKINSKSPYLALLLKQTPKLIGRIKELAPGAALVGFKLTSGAKDGELMAAAAAQIESCGCDYVLANDLSGITETAHRAMLIDSTGILGRAGTKPEIARMIFNQINNRKGRKRE